MTQANISTTVSLLESQIGKWVARKDIYRAEPTNPDSAFLSYNVLTDAEGRIAYFDQRNEDGVIEWGVAPLPLFALPVFKIQRLTYNTESLGTRILSGVRRYFQHEDTVFMALDITDSGETAKIGGKDIPLPVVTPVATWRWNRAEKHYFGDGQASALSGVDAGAVQRGFLETVIRLNSNKPAMDQRKPEFDGKKTAYGHFRDQQAADRASRK